MQDNLFNLPESQKYSPPKTLDGRRWHHQMIKIHGGRSDVCGHCVHLRKNPDYNHAFWKCERSRLTHGAGTDWRKKWQACGLFELKR